MQIAGKPNRPGSERENIKSCLVIFDRAAHVNTLLHTFTHFYVVLCAFMHFYTPQAILLCSGLIFL